VKTGAATLPGHAVDAAEQRRLQVDDAVPGRAMRPVDADDAAHGLHLCDQAGAAVVVWGGGTQMRLGNPPARYQVAFSTERMQRLLEYEPADLTCRVQAGMRLAELNRSLLARGQRLPLEPPYPEQATVGGMLAANSNGLSRARYGTVRDWVIGIAVAYPSGKLARAGGKVVKNVAGYDLMKLHIGALGTLGVIAEVNFKVQTRPETQETVFGHFDSADAAVLAGLQLSRQYLAPAAAVVLDRRTLWQCGLTADWAWTLALRLEGYRRETEVARDRATATIRDAGGRVEAPEARPGFWDAARDWPAPREERVVVLRAIVPLAQTVALLGAVGADAQLMAQPASGLVDVRVPEARAASALTELRRTAGEQGQVVVTSAPRALKESLDVWGPPPPGFPVMRALKQALDPNGILNPGRFVGGI
jgi:glycolate oxidase FAD binding subunit